MEIKTLGVMLTYYQKKYALKPEQICDGICSLATLRRVENGAREIDSLVGEVLLGRIGKEANQFEMLLGEEDYAYWCMREQILEEMENKNYERAEKKIAEYIELTRDLPKVHKQFYLYHMGKIAIARNEDSKKICDIFSEAYDCTKKNASEEQLYSSMEIDIALELIRYKYSKWRECGENIIGRLLFVIDRYYTGQRKESMQVEILLEAMHQAEEKYYGRELVDYIDKAIEGVSKGRSLRYLAELHFKKAKVLENCYHQTKEWKTEEKKCREECVKAYFVLGVQRQEKEEVVKFCEEKLQWHITEQETLFD
jgi:hypothetical protein